MTTIPTDTILEPSLEELSRWVTLWFGQILERRPGNRRRWCARWFDHPEAVTRLRVLMLAHRQVLAHGDALAMSAWMLDHLDRHLDALQSADGPFAGCSAQRHSPTGNLTVTPATTGLSAWPGRVEVA